MAKADDPRHTWRWQQLVAHIRATRPPVCHICRRPIPPGLDGNHKWGPVVDHVHPIAAGADPYDLDNLALAHRWCNGSKGASHGPPPKPPTSRHW